MSDWVKLEGGEKKCPGLEMRRKEGGEIAEKVRGMSHS